MPLRVINGPPNSGRAGLVRQGLLDALERDPLLIVPTLDDVYSFERELCERGAVLGASVLTFDALFRTVATAAGAPPGAELTAAQRLGALSHAVRASRSGLRFLAGSAARPGFVPALSLLLDELQAAGLEPAAVEAAAETLESSAYLGDVSALFAAYARLCERLGRMDRHRMAREAIAALRRSPGAWRRPVFLYGYDDLTSNQRELIESLAEVAEVTVALPYERGNRALEARVGPLLEDLAALGIESRRETQPDPANTDSALLFHLERSFGDPEARRRPPDESLAFLRSAGERGEAEAVGTEVARLIAAGTPADEIAVVVRDPARRGPLLASILESYGIPVALEAELPAARTAVGGALVALLEAELGRRRSVDVLRYLRGPSAVSRRRVDWFERGLRRRRLETASAALGLWESSHGELPADLVRVREAKDDAAGLSQTIAELATAMAGRLEDDFEARAGGAIATAMKERAELDGLAPEPRIAARTVAEIPVRVWSGPPEGRLRIADPYRLRAARFDCVFVASLQDGEFPRRAGSADPFLSEAQRESLGLPPRRDTEAEERYLFHACLALPRKRLFISYRDSDENGAAEPPSPFLADLRRLLEPPESPDGTAGPLEDELVKSRDLATAVPAVPEAPSEPALARAIAARGRDADPDALLTVAQAPPEAAARVGDRLASARSAEAASRDPGPLSHPAVLEQLARVVAYGGTTLEDFDTCSYLWFVSHELGPEPLDPMPEPLLQGGLMHAALEQLFRERPGGDPVPRPGSLPAWQARARELLEEVAKARGVGSHPAERAMRSRAEGLLMRLLEEEAKRDTAGFEPWLLEARFRDDEEAERPALEVDGWKLHGAIDRADRAPDGSTVVVDYKLSGSVTPLDKLEEKAKLQLQLYMIAVADLWGVEAIGGLYRPLGATSDRRMRGVFLNEARDELASYGLVKNDGVDPVGLEQLLRDARERSGTIVRRMRSGDIRRDPGPRRGLPGHDVCPPFCDFAPICRRERAPAEPADEEEER